jgi:phage FluMu gp28-like protein
VPRFWLGIDVGQKVDHSAVCVVEENTLNNSAIVRFIWKFPLGMGFRDLVENLAELYHNVRARGEVAGITIDATGIGSAPAQMLQEKIGEMRVDFFIFTNKTKRQLVGQVKVAHSMGKLRFARRGGDEIYNRMLSSLITEMKSLQMKVIRENPLDPEIEAFSTGQHDDLFTALALAIKDIRFTMPSGPEGIAFIEDKSWAKNPLTEPSHQDYPEAPIYFV